jgi:hypothetical protein
MVVAGIEGDRPGGRQSLRLGAIPREPLVQEAADDGAAHRPAHALPGDGRTGVEHGARRHAGDDVERPADADDRRTRLEDAPHGLPVRGLDGGTGVPLDAIEQREEVGIAARRRSPVDLHHLRARLAEDLAERGQAEVHHPQRRAEELQHRLDPAGHLVCAGHRSAVLPTMRAATLAARMFEPMTRQPARRSRST